MTYCLSERTEILKLEVLALWRGELTAWIYTLTKIVDDAVIAVHT